MGKPTLTKFIAGQTKFLSKGMSRLKITVDDKVDYMVSCSSLA